MSFRIFQLDCATIALADTNIPYFAVKVNPLYRSLIFFKHIVHFQHIFFSKSSTKTRSKPQKLQIGKSIFNTIYTKNCSFFYTYCLTDTKQAANGSEFLTIGPNIYSLFIRLQSSGSISLVWQKHQPRR